MTTTGGLKQYLSTRNLTFWRTLYTFHVFLHKLRSRLSVLPQCCLVKLEPLYDCLVSFRILAFYRVPPVTGRRFNMTYEIKRLADRKLAKTFFISPGEYINNDEFLQ